MKRHVHTRRYIGESEESFMPTRSVFWCVVCGAIGYRHPSKPRIRWTKPTTANAECGKCRYWSATVEQCEICNKSNPDGHCENYEEEL